MVVGGFRGGLLMLGGIFLVFVPDGVLLSLCCIASLSLFLELWLIMMVVLVLLLILLSGLLEVLPKGDGLRCGIGLSYLDRLIYGLVLGSLLLSPLFLAVILMFGLNSVCMLVKWVAFLSSLHWRADQCNLGVGGVSYVELLILYELWAGERLQLEKAVPRYRRPGRSILVSAVPFGPGTDIWRSCRFLGALFRVFGTCRSGFGVLFLVILVLITVGFGTLGGSGVVMVLLPGPVSLRLRIFGQVFGLIWSSR